MRLTCGVLGHSPQAYYAWLASASSRPSSTNSPSPVRPPSRHDHTDRRQPNLQQSLTLLGISACTGDRRGGGAAGGGLTRLRGDHPADRTAGRPAEVRCCPCRAVLRAAGSRRLRPKRAASSSSRSPSGCRRVSSHAGASTPADFLPSAVPARSLWRTSLEEDRQGKRRSEGWAARGSNPEPAD